jgi:hypothetical protein
MPSRNNHILSSCLRRFFSVLVIVQLPHLADGNVSSVAATIPSRCFIGG